MTVDSTALRRTAVETARSLPEVTEGYPFSPGLLVFKVRARVFLIVTDDTDDHVITVKSEPPHVDALVRDHPSVQPGRYLDKHHWLSIGAGKNITRALVEELVQDSYDLVVDNLARGERDRLTSGGVHQLSGRG
ncbi:MmcQ/YjbR family DNA-binding protein [Gordonia sp. CPCC 206044]|uniref:MmcQ/YjbR family DNA-binding protein n=1 Tax=Gordonia sp. CPCC 206044 TaxID=3140793 RepID=UPI003AF3EB7D